MIFKFTLENGYYLFHGKDLVVEIALQLFVGQVDAKLFEAVPLKVLEAKDVEDSHVEVVGGGIGLQVAVESRHNPLEEARVESLGQCVTDVSRLRTLVSLVNCFS